MLRALILLLAITLCAHAAEQVVLVGDSTMATRTGYGDAFGAMLSPNVSFTNLARGGRSSKSYRDEGWWDKVLAEKPTWVFIQFGHNDEPNKGPERATDPATSFPANLARYIDEARAAGAKPVLITSVTRRIFDENGHISSSLTPYVEATIKVAKEKIVPCIDLHRLSIAQCEAIGPEASAAFHFPLKKDDPKYPDRTHFSNAGATATANLVAGEIRKSLPEFAPLLDTSKADYHPDLVYKKAGDRELHLDLSVPKIEQPAPLLVMVHGGGWVAGDKRADFAALEHPLNDAGIAWASIQYRFAPADRWPACYDDVQDAIAWLRRHAADYHINPDRIAVLGYSAGGQIAGMIAAKTNHEHPIRACIGIAPAIDLISDSHRRKEVSSCLRDLLDLPPDINERAISTLTSISPAQQIHPEFPPTLIVQGTADKTCPHQDAKAFVAALKNLHVKADLVSLQNTEHRIADWPDYSPIIVPWLRQVFASSDQTETQKSKSE